MPFLTGQGVRFTAALLATLLAAPGAQSPLGAQTQLNIMIVEGEGAINNIKQRVARDPIVQVEDENRKPVAGAFVTFTLPGNGPSAAFPNGSNILTVQTDNAGRAVARGLRPNNATGDYQIRVTASKDGNTASTVINQKNVAAAAGAGVGTGLIVGILAAVGAATAIGVVVGTRGGNGNGGGPVAPSLTITPGTPNVGPPR